jgi:hypothetical protein
MAARIGPLPVTHRQRTSREAEQLRIGPWIGHNHTRQYDDGEREPEPEPSDFVPIQVADSGVLADAGHNADGQRSARPVSRDPQKGSGKKHKKQQQSGCTFHGNGSSMVRIAQAEPTMQCGDLEKETTQAGRFRPVDFARVRINKIHIAIGGLNLDRGMRVLMGGHHLDGRRKGRRSGRHQRVER